MVPVSGLGTPDSFLSRWWTLRDSATTTIYPLSFKDGVFSQHSCFALLVHVLCFIFSSFQNLIDGE